MKNKEGLAQQELNQSPLPFVESASQPGTASCLKVHRQSMSCLFQKLLRLCHSLAALLLIRVRRRPAEACDVRIRARAPTLLMEEGLTLLQRQAWRRR